MPNEPNPTESITMTRAEFDAAIKAAETKAGNAAWADSRKRFQAKQGNVAERVDKLETLIKTALGILIPGFDAPTTDTASTEEVSA